MMKLKITKALKNTLVIIIVLLIIGAGVCFYLYYTTPHFMKESIIKYQYIHRGDVNYQVYLKPNDVYEEEIMEEGNTYITQIVDNIKVNFIYNFQGDASANIKGDYEIIALMEGYVKQNEVTKTLWVKKFPIAEKTNFEVNGEGISLDKEAIINLNEYNEYSKSIMDNLKVNSSTKLTVMMNVNITADINGLSVQEEMFPAVEIPLNTNYFTIEKFNNEEIPGEIEETERIQVPANMGILIINGVIVVILILTLLYLTKFTEEPKIEDIYLKKFCKIFKNHENRLVALNSKVETSGKNCCSVRTIDDLVRIANEIGKPILYEYSSNYMNITKFYVIDDNWIYVLDTKDYIYQLIGRDVVNKLLNEQKRHKISKIQNLPENITETMLE